MRQSLDAHLAPSSSGMRSLRGLSYGLRTAIGHGGSSSYAAAHPTATSRQLQAAQHSSPWLPAGLLVGAQHRACAAAAGTASENPAADDADAAQPNPGSHGTPDSAGSSSSSTASSRAVNEHVAAASATAPAQAAVSARQASSSSGSRRPAGPPRSRSGPGPPRRLPPGFRPVLPPRPAAAPLLRTAAPPSQANAAASSSSSSRGSSNTSSANGVGSDSTSGSTNSANGSSIQLGSNGSSTSSYQQEQWQQQESLNRPIKLSDIRKIRDSGLTAIPGWFVLERVWPGLRQQWEEAKQQLSPAMKRLMSVSQSGDIKVVFFDLETTGSFQDGIPEILELAAVTADGQTFPPEGSSSLMRPLGSIAEGAFKTHGMRNRDLTEQPCAPVVLLQWLEWLTEQCQSAPGGSCTLVLAGHNIAAFDEPIVAVWFQALRLSHYLVSGLQAEALGWRSAKSHLPWLGIDTLRLAREYKDALDRNSSLHPAKLENAQLQTLIPHFGVTVEGPAHRALPDVLGNQQVFMHLLHWQLELAGQVRSLVDMDTLAAEYLKQRQQQQQPQTQQPPSGQPAGASKLPVGPPPQQQPQPPPPQQQQPQPPPQQQQQPQPSPPQPQPPPPQQQQQQEEQVANQDLQQQVLSYTQLIVNAAAAAEAGDVDSFCRLTEQMPQVQAEFLSRLTEHAAQQQKVWMDVVAEECKNPFGDPIDFVPSSSEASTSTGSFQSSSSSSGSSFGAAAGSAAASGSSAGSSSSSAGNSSSSSSSCSSTSSRRAGGERGGCSNISLESSGSMPPLDPQVVESAVAAGLESLAGQDLTWDPQQLSQAWPLLGDPLNPKDKIVSAGLYSKLLDAGFSNHLQVLQQTPTVVKYHDSVPVEASSSSSTEAGLSEDSIDGAEGVPGDSRPFVFFNNAKVLAVTQPRMSKATFGAVWSAVLQAPANPPSAGPVAVLYTMFQPGSRNWGQFAVKQVMDGPYKQAYEAAVNGTDVLFKGRLKRHVPGDKSYVQQWQPQDPALPITWEVASSTPAAEVSWDGADSLSVSAGLGEVLEPRYDKKGLSAEDWLGSGRSSGIISPLLSTVRERGMQDILPEALRQQYDLGSWLEDVQEVHRPTSEQQYKRACKGIAMRELVLMQVAQFLERYRLTTSGPDGVIAAVNDLLLPRQTADDSSAPCAAAAATKPKRAAGKKGSRSAATASGAAAAGGSMAGANSSGTSNGSSSCSSDEAHQLLAVRSTQLGEAVLRGAAAFSVSCPDAMQKARRELASTYGWDLTEDQERVLQELQADMKGPRAMLRLLQGDVGCGKTIIALLACLETAASGYQALLFAPTELLATQHYKTLERLTEELPMGVRPRIGILTGSLTTAAKRSFKQEIAEGRLNIIISTQAALYVDAWDKLALVVIDEQHKMGVKQRERLTRKVEAPPHMLLMTATPIPRTLAIMQYGGMSLSTISQLPPGRTPVETHVVQDDDLGRQQVYAAIKQEIVSGGRAYIVCPLVSESDSDAMAGVRTVEEEFARLSGSGIFGDGSECGKLHGRMSAEEKREVLESFKRGDTHVLIASTVVEVGVDVPEASVMLVEAANRFGLAQLHQLRGRVGRGSKASKCYLMAPAGDATATERLQELEKSHNGLHIAEADLRIRGPGDLWSGTKQSGKSSHLSPITMRQLQADPHIMEHARLVAAQLLLGVSQDTALKAAVLASGIMELRKGQKLPVARYGISGM